MKADLHCSRVLAKATKNAAHFLGLSSVELGAVLGIDEKAASGVVEKNDPIDPAADAGKAALMLIKMFLMLDALVGGDCEAKLDWMTSHNAALGAVPKLSIQNPLGLIHVVAYLNGFQMAGFSIDAPAHGALCKDRKT